MSANRMAEGLRFFFLICFVALLLFCAGCSGSGNHKADSKPILVDDIEIEQVRALLHGQQGDKLKAAAILKKLIVAEPDNYEARCLLAESYKENSEIERAKKVLLDAKTHLEKSESSTDNTVFLNRFTQLGECAFLMEMYDISQDLLVQTKQHAKKSKHPYMVSKAAELLARIHTINMQYDLAEGALELSRQSLGEYREEDKSFWGCMFHARAMMYVQMDRMEKACKNFSKSADLEKDNPITQFNAALACHKAGEADKALNYADIGLSTDNLDFLKSLKGFIFISKGETEKAKAIFIDTLEGKGEIYSAMAGLGHLYLLENDLANAEKYLIKAAAMPGSGVAGHQGIGSLTGFAPFILEIINTDLGWIYARQNRFGEAVESFDKTLDINPKSFKALLGKANAMGQLGQFDQAKKVLDRAVKENPEDQYVLAELALLEFNRGNLALSEKTFRKALSVSDSGYACPYEGLGLIYLKQGKLKQAKINLKKAIETNPDEDFKKFNALAEIYFKEGKTEKGKKLLEKSLRNNPSGTEAKQMLKSIEDK